MLAMFKFTFDQLDQFNPTVSHAIASTPASRVL